MAISTHSVTDALPPGTRLQDGHFAVSKVLGQGGFGITYHGGDLQKRQYVAIKEFFPQGSTRQNGQVQPCAAMPAADYENARKKFIDEARSLARFNHNNIVHAKAIFEENNTAYLVMEFLKGKTLQELIEARKVLPEREAIAIIEQIGAALTAIHNANLIHRDIKPDNIMLCDDGRAVLIDFGLNKDIEHTGKYETRRLTATTRLGTEGYAPPEQYLKSSQTGVFTDVYALGATLYYLLTGVVPVSAPERSMGMELVPPERVNPHIGRDVSDAVMSAMAIKTGERPQNVPAFLNLLHSKPSISPRQQGNTQTTGIIEITRIPQFFSKFRSYIIFVDNNKVGKIKDNETVQFEILSGTHDLQVRIDWITSNLHRFPITPGERLSFEVGSIGSKSLYVCPQQHQSAPHKSSKRPIKLTSSAPTVKRGGPSGAEKEAARIYSCTAFGGLVGWILDLLGLHAGSIPLLFIGLGVGALIGWIISKQD